MRVAWPPLSGDWSVAIGGRFSYARLAAEDRHARGAESPYGRPGRRELVSLAVQVSGPHERPFRSLRTPVRLRLGEFPRPRVDPRSVTPFAHAAHVADQRDRV